MKKFYAIALMACAAMSTFAAHNHGVNIQMNQNLLPAGDVEGWECRVEAMYFPNYVQSQNKDVMGSGVYEEGDVTTLAKAQPALEAGQINGRLLQTEMKLGDDGLVYVTVPDEAYIDGKLVKVDGGDIRIRIAYGGSPYRPGDTKDFYVYDTKSLYATVSAPAGTKINGYIVAANCSTFKNSENGCGDEANGKYWHTASFDFAPLTASNTPTDLATVGDAYGSTNLFTFRRESTKKGLDKCDSAGFPCKFFDVVFRGLKTGDKVGLTNYQTVCPDYTPVPYTSGASVGGMIVDENAPVEYFNLQGVKVAEPANGIFIRRQGAKVEKVILK